MTTNGPERADQQLLETLREQTQVLLTEIPGPLRKVSVTAGDAAVTVEWADPQDPTASHGRHPHAAQDGTAATGADPATGAAEANGHVAITAPLVGTFYRCPEPGADPFVEAGSTVEAGHTVGIVEAMKLMNPVKAGQPGTVVEIHVEDGEMVEFGQPLVTLDPPTS